MTSLPSPKKVGEVPTHLTKPQTYQILTATSITINWIYIYPYFVLFLNIRYYFRVIHFCDSRPYICTMTKCSHALTDDDIGKSTGKCCKCMNSACISTVIWRRRGARRNWLPRTCNNETRAILSLSPFARATLRRGLPCRCRPWPLCRRRKRINSGSWSIGILWHKTRVLIWKKKTQNVNIIIQNKLSNRQNGKTYSIQN